MKYAESLVYDDGLEVNRFTARPRIRLGGVFFDEDESGVKFNVVAKDWANHMAVSAGKVWAPLITDYPAVPLPTEQSIGVARQLRMWNRGYA